MFKNKWLVISCLLAFLALPGCDFGLFGEPNSVLEPGNDQHNFLPDFQPGESVYKDLPESAQPTPAPLAPPAAQPTPAPLAPPAAQQLSPADEVKTAPATAIKSPPVASQPEQPPLAEVTETFPLETTAPPANQTEENNDEFATPTVAIIRFLCSVSQEKVPGVTYVKLTSSTQAVDKQGQDASGRYLFGGGQGSISNGCTDPADQVPVCIDPRTGATATALDFTVEFPNTSAGQSQHADWFSRMTNSGKRSCTAEELTG